MAEHDWLAAQFEENRAHLRSVACRLLGSLNEADDAVQESWLRLSRSDTSGVQNLGGWLTTVVARVCLDMLRLRQARREQPLDAQFPDAIPSPDSGLDPEHEALLADSVGSALVVVLETLAPAERLAFVLHDLFAVPFDEIAPIVGRTPVAARQLASRARRRVQGAGADEAVTQDRPSNLLDADRTRQREIVDAFLAASRGGDFEALLAMLAPDVVLRADHTAVLASAARESQGAPKLAPEARGAAAVVEIFGGRARAAQPAVINGAPGLAWAPGGQPRVVFAFTITSGKIVEINMVADPVHLGRLDLALLEG